MPCTSAGYAEAEQQQRINELTRLLCLACGELEEAQVPVDPEIQYWWYEHRLQDAKRVRSQNPQQAKEMLSSEIAGLTRVIQRDEADLRTAEANEVEESVLVPFRLRLAAWESRRAKYLNELAELSGGSLPAGSSGNRVPQKGEN